MEVGRKNAMADQIHALNSQGVIMNLYLNQIFNLEGKVAVVIGGGGYLCSEMARGFARAGCAVASLDLRLEKAKVVEDELRAAGFDRAISIGINVVKKQEHVNALEQVLTAFGQVDILVNVCGGGLTGQAGAVRLGIARALTQLDTSLRAPLKKAKFLVRDSRKRERKKYGRKRARRRFQYTKR